MFKKKKKKKNSDNLKKKFCQKKQFLGGGDTILLERNFLLKKIVRKKILNFSWTEFCLGHCLGLNLVSDFQCAYFSCLGQIDVYHH